MAVLRQMAFPLPRPWGVALSAALPDRAESTAHGLARFWSDSETGSLASLQPIHGSTSASDRDKIVARTI